MVGKKDWGSRPHDEGACHANSLENNSGLEAIPLKKTCSSLHDDAVIACVCYYRSNMQVCLRGGFTLTT